MTNSSKNLKNIFWCVTGVSDLSNGAQDTPL